MDDIHIPIYEDNRPDVNERYRRAAEQTLAQFQRRTSESAFTRFIRLQQSLTYREGDTSVLMHAAFSSRGRFPMISIVAANYPAFKPAFEEVSTWTTQRNSPNKNLQATIFHEGSHSVVDELTHWHPEGPFPMLDVLVRAMGISSSGFDGNVSGLARSLNRLLEQAADSLLIDSVNPRGLMPPAFGDFSDYGFESFAKRWGRRRHDKGFDTPFYGLQLFKGESATDAALERWNALDRREQRITQQFLYAADEALTDAVAQQFRWGASNVLEHEIASLVESTFSMPTQRVETVTRYWAHELLDSSALGDLRQVDLEMAAQAYEARGRERAASEIRSGYYEVNKSLFIDSSSNQILRLLAESKSVFQAPNLLPMTPAHLFSPLLGSVAPSRGQRYWLLEFDSTGALAHARYEVNGRAIEPTIPVLGRDPNTGMEVMRPGGKESSPIQRVASATYLAEVLAQNAIGDQQLEQSATIAIALAILDTSHSRVLLTEDALLASIAKHENVQQHSFDSTWVDGQLIELDNERALFTLSLRTPSTSAVLVSGQVQSDADDWMKSLKHAALAYAKDLLGVDKEPTEADAVVMLSMDEPMNAMAFQFSLPVATVARTIQKFGSEPDVSTELSVEGLTMPNLQGPLREVLLDEVVGYVADALEKQVDKALDQFMDPITKAMDTGMKPGGGAVVLGAADFKEIDRQLTRAAAKRMKHFDNAFEGVPLHLLDDIHAAVREEVSSCVERTKKTHDFVVRNYDQIIEAACIGDEQKLDSFAAKLEEINGDAVSSSRVYTYRETDTVEIVWRLCHTTGIETLGTPLEYLDWSGSSTRASVAVEVAPTTLQPPSRPPAGSERRVDQGGMGI